MSADPREVGAALAAQAPRALAELLRGLVAADADAGAGELGEEPGQLCAALITVTMRIVVLLYAEARGLTAPDPSGAVAGLLEQLRADASADPDGLDRRSGAWARLRAQFRRVFEGGDGSPARGGQLFDPDRCAILDGGRDGAEPPRISDAAVSRVLEALSLVDGEPVSYASLDVEELGSIYEAIMAFELDGAPGPALALTPTQARRRSGSHYTPRALTESIVRTTLAPILDELGPQPRPEQLLALKICDPAMGSGAFLVEACRQLGEALARSWEAHGAPAGLSEPSAATALARRLVATRCLYGVDKNPVAVELAKLSLWLLASAGDQSFDFVDHALACGDSLLGLGLGSISAFGWDAPPAAGRAGAPRAGESSVAELRRRADAVLAALLHSTKATTRERQRARLRALVESGDGGDAAQLDAILTQLRARYGPPFHWELELPEVFDRPNPGFDAIVGNPPFQGGRVISASLGTEYTKALIELYPGASGGTDLCAFFMRRAFGLLREGGCFGLIATNTISQGDTRVGGLAVLRAEGANLYDVRRRVDWPGAAAVIVSVVHCRRGPTADKRIDGVVVNDVTAFLMAAGPDEPPRRLARPGYRCFQGNIVLGLGFTFDDRREKATPLAQMRRLIEANPANAERIFPYLGGREVNEHPTHEHHRYVINFEEMSEAEARRWPELFALIEAKVLPERAVKDAHKYPRMVHEWWKFWCYRSELYAHTRGFARVLVVPLISKHLSICLLPANYVISHKLAAFSLEGMAAFAILQSRIHEIWTRLFSSTLGDGLNYSPTDCFETFPFPDDWASDAALERAGQRYYDYRAALMLRTNEGLTRIYNRFHDRDEGDQEIAKLRELHADMDRAVLEAYGWRDLAAGARSEFALDYPVSGDEGRKRLPWRYRWPGPIHDEILARLLARNAAQAESDPDRGAG